VEEQDIVYRRQPSPARSSRAQPAPADATWIKDHGRSVLLFPVSALTFNGHRIHYHRHITGTEGYPGLIVHGPLMGLVQMELARRSNPGRMSASFEFRAVSPVYAGNAFSVQARRDADGSIATWIADANGGLAQQGKAVFR
jgi:hydroxyacyl-ACP dehydratase HTD2-like protein with hotdog domain